MKTSLSAVSSLCLAACAAVSFTASLAAQNATEPPQPPQPGYNQSGPGVTVKESMVSEDDREFLRDAAKSGLKEVTVSKAVLPHLTRTEARSFAQMMVTDHTAANTELKLLARRKSVELPPEDEKKGKLEKKWAEKSDDLDDDYLDEMIKDHKEAVELFEEGAKSKDADIAAFARKTLPKLKQHLDLAKRHAGEHDDD